jgi:hypothetical protein
MGLIALPCGVPHSHKALIEGYKRLAITWLLSSFQGVRCGRVPLGNRGAYRLNRKNAWKGNRSTESPSKIVYRKMVGSVIAGMTDDLGGA